MTALAAYCLVCLAASLAACLFAPPGLALVMIALAILGLLPLLTRR